MLNPFYYGHPTPPSQFIDRRRELRRIGGRIINQGQSTAIIGEPHSGKTSLLLYLSAPETQRSLYGADGEHLLFSYLDVQTLGAQFSQAQFWEYVLHPLYEKVIVSNPDLQIATAYHVCRENNFGTFVLERFLAQVATDRWRLVLLLDEFNNFLHHPILNNAEFFGSLRSLVSRSRGALALVIASRYLLQSLNKDTQEFSRTGSPYFNFLDEIILGPLPDKDIAELLSRAGDRFTTDDRHFIIDVAGGHPCLLQMAASELWDAYEEGGDHPDLRQQRAGESLYRKSELIMSDTWRVWSPMTRQAFTAVALAHLPTILKQHKFHTGRFIRDMSDFGPELQLLAKQGFIAEDMTIDGGWRVRPSAFLWWLADELVRTVRREATFEEWLQAQEWSGVMTRGQKQEMNKAVGAIMNQLKGGVKTLIEAAAKGTGGALLD